MSDSDLSEGLGSVYLTKAHARKPGRTGSSSCSNVNQAAFALVFKIRNVCRTFNITICFAFPLKGKLDRRRVKTRLHSTGASGKNHALQVAFSR